MRKQLLVLFAITLLTSLSGCLDTRQGLKSRTGDKTVLRKVKDENVEFPTLWRRVALGFKPKVELGGYIRTDRERSELGNVLRTHWVFDKEFNKMGFFFDSGVAYKRNSVGKFVKLGTFDLDFCITQILDRKGPVNYYTMPPPEGSDIPYRDEINPPKQEKKAAPAKKDEDEDE